MSIGKKIGHRAEAAKGSAMKPSAGSPGTGGCGPEAAVTRPRATSSNTARISKTPSSADPAMTSEKLNAVAVLTGPSLSVPRRVGIKRRQRCLAQTALPSGVADKGRNVPRLGAQRHPGDASRSFGGGHLGRGDCAVIIADLDELTQIMPGHAMPPAADSQHGPGSELLGGTEGRLTLFSCHLPGRVHRQGDRRGLAAWRWWVCACGLRGCRPGAGGFRRRAALAQGWKLRSSVPRTRLTVQWQGHGRRKIAGRCCPCLRRLRVAALVIPIQISIRCDLRSVPAPAGAGTTDTGKTASIPAFTLHWKPITSNFFPEITVYYRHGELGFPD